MNAPMRWLPFLSLLLTVAGALPAQDGTLTVKAAIEPATAKPGDKVVLVLSATVSAGWHAYGTAEKTNIPVDLKADKLELGGLQADGAPEIPPGERHAGPFETFPLPNLFTVKQSLKVPAGLAPGEITVSGAFDFQICDANMCLPPDEAKFTAKVKIEAGAAPQGASGTTPTPRTETKPGLRLLPDAKIAVAAKFDPAPARAGEISTLVLTVKVLDEAYHAYGTLEKTNIPVHLDPPKVDAGGLELVGGADVPPGELKKSPVGDSYPLPHEFVVKQVMRVPAGTKPGSIVVDGALSVQICNANSCLPVEDVNFKATLAIEAGEARANASKPPVAKGDTRDGGFAGWWWLILSCFGGGLFALAMPCTYPMIPITFSFFTKQAEKRGGNVMSLAIVYGLGIVLMFTLVGAALSSVIIDVVNHWVTNVVIGAMFVFFAFVLFGWVNLQPPRFLTNAAGKAGATGGYLGVFFMGATLVISSFTCTAPIVGSLLANVAQYGTGPVAFGMAIFGATMACPFVFLSLVPGKVKAMPRSGEWMETLKVSLGFVELAAALKFVSMVDFAFGWQILPRELFLFLWTAIFGMWAMYLFGILRKAGTPNEGVGAGRMASGMLVTLLATYFLFGALGNKLDAVMTGFIPGYSNSLVSSAGGRAARGHAGDHTLILDDQKHAIEVAKAEDKLLLYNFTGFN
jgi:thiol:disulfide interchange protein DsbD